MLASSPIFKVLLSQFLDWSVLLILRGDSSVPLKIKLGPKWSEH